MKPWRVLFVAILFGVGAAGQAAAGISGTSFWKNQRGSSLQLIADATGHIKGTFTTAVGCGAGKPRALIGTYNGSALSLTVNFQECRSITAWNGHLMNQFKRIDTLWLLTLAGAPQWNSTVAGADSFRRIRYRSFYA